MPSCFGPPRGARVGRRSVLRHASCAGPGHGVGHLGAFARQSVVALHRGSSQGGCAKAEGLHASVERSAHGTPDSRTRGRATCWSRRARGEVPRQVPQLDQLQARRDRCRDTCVVRGRERPLAGRDGRAIVQGQADPSKPVGDDRTLLSSGRPHGDPVPGQAELLAPSALAHVNRLMARKYRIDRVLILPLYRAVQRRRGTRSPPKVSLSTFITSGK